MNNRTIIKTLVILFCLLLYVVSLAVVPYNILGMPKYLILSATLFAIGLYGLLTAKSIVKVFICLELLFNATGINLIAFSHYTDITQTRGQMMNLFIMGVAAAEISIGLALLMTIFARKGVTRLNKLNTLSD